VVFLWFCSFVILVFWICGFGFWSWVLVLPEIKGEEEIDPVFEVSGGGRGVKG